MVCHTPDATSMLCSLSQFFACIDNLPCCTPMLSKDDTPEDGYNSAHNSAKKKGFKNAVDFLQSRGIPLTVKNYMLV